MGQHYSGGNIPPPGYCVNNVDVSLFFYGNNRFKCLIFVLYFHIQLSNDCNSMNYMWKTRCGDKPRDMRLMNWFLGATLGINRRKAPWAGYPTR